ncbi:MAG: FHA domain-containing protein [Vicinamibacterales bacterium]
MAAASTVEISLATVRRTRAGPPIQLGRCGNLQVRFPGIISTLSGRFVNGPVGQQRFSIGRSADCDVVVADDTVSRKHAELIVLDGGVLRLVDCQSTHGTQVTDGGRTRAIVDEIVTPATVVHFGDTTMPVAELLSAVRARRPDARLPANPSGRTFPAGVTLVRCSCGTIKPKGSRCPECGE